MLTAPDTNTPAPWVPFTRAGCNFGSVATANTILENTAIDTPTVFGLNSPEVQEVKTNPKQAFADFVGIGIHCAQGNALCSSTNNGRPDVLPTEPGGYSGFMGLFGHKYVAPQISPNGPLTDLNGNVIQDPTGHIGFPGFDGMAAAVSLSYVAAMQEHGVPVTFNYISDAHDAHPDGPAYGPGQAGPSGCHTIRPSPSSLIVWRMMALTRATPCSYSPPTRAITSWVVPPALRAATA
jgi:hypothetical protein